MDKAEVLAELAHLCSLLRSKARHARTLEQRWGKDRDVALSKQQQQRVDELTKRIDEQTAKKNSNDKFAGAVEQAIRLLCGSNEVATWQDEIARRFKEASATTWPGKSEGGDVQ